CVPAAAPATAARHTYSTVQIPCHPPVCRPVPVFYRVAANTVQQSNDGGLSWRVIFDAGGHPRSRDRRSCAPARYVAIATLLLERGRRGHDSLYVATRGTPGNYRKHGCDAAVGGLYLLRDGALLTLNAGLPFDQDAARRTIRAYNLAQLRFDPKQRTALLVDARGGHGPHSPRPGLYRSADGGHSWHALPSGRPGRPTPRPTRTPTPRPRRTPTRTAT